MHVPWPKGIRSLAGTLRHLLSEASGRSRPDRGIGRISTAVLVAAVLCTGLTSYAYLRASLVRDRTTILEAELERRSQQLTLALLARTQTTRALAAQSHTALAMHVYQSEEAGVMERTSALMTLQSAAGSLLREGDLRAVEFRTRAGDRLASAAYLEPLPALSVPLFQGSDTIYWDDGLVLRLSVNVVAEDGIAGMMIADVRVRTAEAVITGTERLGETGEAGVCGLNGAQRICFPSRFQPGGSIGMVGNPAVLSVDRALAGDKGTLQLVDYRGHSSYSSFQPLDASGLVLVVKVDEAELLAPIRQQMMLGVPLLLLLAAAGATLIVRQLRPLTAELVSARLRADSEVASRAQAEAEIRLANRRLQLVADNASFMIGFVDPDFIFRFANRAHVLWFKRPLDQIIGRTMAEVVGQVRFAECRLAMAAALASNLPQRVFRERLVGGESKFLELTFVAQHDDDGRLEGYCVTARDATESVNREQALLLAARRDPLTGLGNRTSFNERLEQALRTAGTDLRLLAVAYLDVDHFKRVNDSFGHDVGDQLLKQLGERIGTELLHSDTAARLGGDEFALIMRLDATDNSGSVGSRLLARIRQPYLIEQQSLRATASIGFAMAVPGDTASSLLKRADAALYRAKAEGRDRVCQAQVDQALKQTA